MKKFNLPIAKSGKIWYNNIVFSELYRIPRFYIFSEFWGEISEKYTIIS